MTKREHASPREARSHVSSSTTGRVSRLRDAGTVQASPAAVDSVARALDRSLSVRRGASPAIILDHSIYFLPMVSKTSACFNQGAKHEGAYAASILMLFRGRSLA